MRPCASQPSVCQAAIVLLPHEHFLTCCDMPHTPPPSPRLCLQALGLAAAERFPTLLAVAGFDDETSLVMASSLGGIKRTPLSAFSKLRATGLAAIRLQEVMRRVF